ncbi:MAG TPA: DNA-directed RNA polymerase subunit delta [Firmicutes bacterium]|jgi:DNA-directed RNA polymerase subunit delta|nr:DNA-directed RNA polymerase subunit delta [Bacillota bacterium]HHW98657.1 DNA-directed RNA polymerase subunit delta [Bacillota bacterium]
MENKKKEPLSVTDVAYQILREHKAPMHYRELIIAALERMGEDTAIPGARLAQIHTEINLDSRFDFLGKGMWGLQAWTSKSASKDTGDGPSERRYQPKAADYMWDEEEEEELEDEEDGFIPDDEDLDSLNTDEEDDELNIDDLLDDTVDDIEDMEEEEEEPEQ